MTTPLPPRRPRARTVACRVLPLGVAAAAALTVAACSGSTTASSSTSPSATVSPSSSPSSTGTSSATGGASPTSSSSGGSSSDGSSSGGSSSGGGAQASGVQVCAESQLRASIDPRGVKGSSKSGKGADYAVIVDFTNKSGSSCIIRGYPGAALVDSSGKQVQQATRTIRGRLLGLPVGTNSLPSVTLKPGQVASAGIEGVNQQEYGAAQAGCDATYPRILVTPPNTKTPVPFTVSWPKCFSFDVHPTNIATDPPSSS